MIKNMEVIDTIQGHLKVRIQLSLGKYEGVWNKWWVHLYLEHLSFLGCFRVSWVMLSILELSSRITITTTTRCRNDKGARTSWASSHNLRYKSMWWIPLSRFKKVEIDFWRWRPLYSFNDAHETIAHDQVRFCNLISFGVIFRDFYILLGDTDVKFQSSKAYKLKWRPRSQSPCIIHIEISLVFSLSMFCATWG